jgi:hypothetical protein
MRLNRRPTTKITKITKNGFSFVLFRVLGGESIPS